MPVRLCRRRCWDYSLLAGLPNPGLGDTHVTSAEADVNQKKSAMKCVFATDIVLLAGFPLCAGAAAPRLPAELSHRLNLRRQIFHRRSQIFKHDIEQWR